MDRAFSGDEISGQLWSPPPPPSPHRRPEGSDGDGEKEVVVIQKPGRMLTPDRDDNDARDGTVRFGDDCEGGNAAAIGNAGKIPVDCEEYQAFLKGKLNLACAAVALSRASFVTRHESASLDFSQTAKTRSQPFSKGPGHHKSRSLEKERSSLSAIQMKAAVPAWSGTSGSSIDQWDDDEIEETATTENMNPADAKRVRRMLSNRESARRSRKRKQAHLVELETQVAQLRVENSSLSKRLGNVKQKFTEAAGDNQVLKADVENLRAKVKMVEERVKRLTGYPIFHTMLPEISLASMPSFDDNPSDASPDAAVPVQDEPKNRFYQSDPSNPLPSSQDTEAKGDIPDASATCNNVQPKRAPLMERVASLEHLQKLIRGDLDDSKR